MDTIQLYVRNQGLSNNTIALADLLQEDPVADTAANQQPEATVGHPVEAGPTGVVVEVLTTSSTGHPSATTGKGEALHHIFIRLAILHIFPRPYAAEGQLVTDRASDGHTSFHTTLHVDTKQGAKYISVKVDPGAEVNTVPLSHYRKLFKKTFTKAGNIKKNVLHPTSHLWSSHDSKPQQFLGYFIINIHHKTISKTLPVRFYVFQDTTNPPILLSYSASERLGIIEFKVPN